MHTKAIAPESSDGRRVYYDRISTQNLTPPWEAPDAPVPARPCSPAVPALSRYADLRPQVMEARRLITAAEAERCVLILENPALRGQSCITQSLYARLQLILPGEVAPAHRHSRSALRLVLDYVNRATGASPMPPSGVFAQRLPEGFETRPYRCTDGAIDVCLDGQGEAEVNGEVYRFAENDIFFVPSWHSVRIRALRDTLLFSYSDRPVQQVLGRWREQRH